MCGIAGILRVHSPGRAVPPLLAAIPETWLDLLDGAIMHRGPDGHGRFRDRGARPDGTIVDVAFVHRRLSIIDHAGGHQPMVLCSAARSVAPAGVNGGPEPYRRTLDQSLRPCPRCAALGLETIAVVFNGCIYNHRGLRRELQAAGHVFSTDHSDTEVLAHGWGEWGLSLASRLDGMFATATWGSVGGVLALVRDPFGEKPLYTTSLGAGITAFASTAPSLLRLRGAVEPGGANGARLVGVREWIKFGWDESTPFEGLLEECPGGSRVVSGMGGEPGPVRMPEGVPRPVTADEVDAALASAVAGRLEADVPIGCFLSGGLDSALVCHYARRSRPDITAFTVRMPSATYDESEAASATARALGVRHEVLECAPRPADDLVAAIRQLGLPFGDSSLLPSLWVSRAARARATVALSGDGGDEMFCGYDRYRAVQPLSLLSRLPRPLLRALAAAIPPGPNPKSARSRLARLLHAAGGSGYEELVAVFDSPHDRGIGLNDDWSSRPASRIEGGRRGAHMLARLFDMTRYLPFDLMRKTDTASMAVALEVRAPFLARAVARLGMEANLDSLLPGGERKGLLRAVARRHLPPEIVNRPKQGFAVPIGEWFRSDYGGLRQLLLDHLNGSDPFGPDRLGVGSMIDMAYVKRMLREHDDVGSGSLWPWKGRDHSQRLYMLLVLSIWARWVGGL
jgi:asparagine synthase (glutamine-hydrolysing)